MAFYTDSPAFQQMFSRAMGGSTDYRPLGLSGIANPRAKKQSGYLPPKPQPKPAAKPLNAPGKNPYSFDLVASKTSNAPGGGDTFGTMGTGQGQARSNQAAMADAQGQATALTAKMNAGMSPAQVTAGSAPVAAAKPVVKAAPKVAAKMAPRSLLQSREPGAGFGGIRPMMNFGR